MSSITIKTLVAVSSLLLANLSHSQTLTVEWTWKTAHKCSTSSPALKIEGIPDGVKTLTVEMVDLDYRSFDHGGGSVTHDGKAATTIPEGSLKNYRGPCPRNFSSFGHDYEFSVKALGADGATLSKGSKTKTFSAKTVTD